MRLLDIRRLGRVSYADALVLQHALVDERKADRIPDTLLLLEHPHVLTLGVKAAGARTHIVAGPERLAQLGVDVFEAGRGGDATYHGPGQVIGYPIIDLRPDRQDVHRYVRDLEDVMMRVAADFAVEARRIAGLTGIWVSGGSTDQPEAKLGAIGIRISRWVTSHGFAFNVNTDLEFFRLIVPCGIADRGVTSLEHLLGRAQSMRDVEARFVHHMGSVFERDIRMTVPCAGSLA
ncbi:MAG: lipoyl(octanoyl) transferase LipB [Acidobacteria bacterium]|nr:lipoyl(octanoyl) transferase LipB [Acidobacteriota bacterium]